MLKYHESDGVIVSEIGVAEMLWFADRYSEDAVKCLYAFPTYRQLDSFVQTRLNPVLHKGYYSTILSPENDSIKSKQIRKSFLLFRSASKASSVEGVDVDYLSLDEYDRISKQAEESAIESMSSSKFQWNRRWSTPKQTWVLAG